MEEATYRGTVYPWQCDHVGHMNIMWYVGKFDEANWNLFARVVKPGRTLTVCEAKANAEHDGVETLIATMTGTLMALPSPPTKS
jgi:hypothetical protein